MRRISFFIFALLLFQTVISAQDDNEDLTWPREFTVKKFLITVYQPQLESFKKNILEGRIAVSIKPEDKDILFCAAWFKAMMETDLDERIVTLKKMQITKIHFPDYDNQKVIDKLSRVLEKEFESWNITMSLDRLTASLDDVEDLKTKSETFNNAPPDIYFRTIPSSLISIDGDPIMKDVKDSGLEYVVNTAFFIVREKGKSTYYIKGGKFWYQSDDITSNWKATEKVPKDIMKFAEENIEATKPDSISASITESPALVVVTKPSELIQTDGEPDYQSIENTSLLYVKNTESDIIMDINSQEHFVLLAGRWYQSKTLAAGDWKFTEPEKLPEDFSKIPDSSDMGNVRASVPGTQEAQDALLEQSIPQTAQVDRKTATVEVKYDGEPKFEKVEGTDVYYAVNTDKQVLRIDNRYYCVDNAIWFVSNNATGPWVVSDKRPDEVDEI
ncbi:MAG: carbohydrate-binding family V/XII, partial [Chlorobi bacterium]|nr:carbohydrate-binding family V/XII [Chlorobiota bacterium]